MQRAWVMRTGVELRLAQAPDEFALGDAAYRRELSVRDRAGETVVVKASPFVDLDFGNGPQRWHSSAQTEAVELDRDPANQLMEMVDFGRSNLINLWGDLAHGADYDVTRWEFYGAPFEVDLDAALAKRLAGAWQPRPPRLR